MVKTHKMTPWHLWKQKDIKTMVLCPVLLMHIHVHGLCSLLGFMPWTWPFTTQSQRARQCCLNSTFDCLLLRHFIFFLDKVYLLKNDEKECHLGTVRRSSFHAYVLLYMCMCVHAYICMYSDMWIYGRVGKEAKIILKKMITRENTMNSWFRDKTIHSPLPSLCWLLMYFLCRTVTWFHLKSPKSGVVMGRED